MNSTTDSLARVLAQRLEQPNPYLRGPDPVKPLIKNCLTCAYRSGYECRVTGRFWAHQRGNHAVGCDATYSGYSPRRSIRQWLFDTFWR